MRYRTRGGSAQAWLLALCLVLAGCQAEPEWVIKGVAMGTGYSVRLPRPPASIKRDDLERLTASQIEEIEALMSTYRPQSELSRFNDSPSTEWFEVSELTLAVVEAGQGISLQTDGAFDVTVGPLVELWGFGARPSTLQRPSTPELEQARQAVGFQKLELRQNPPALRKHHPELRVDLSAIAKGFAADRVCEALEKLGIKNYMVEIGGDLRVAGSNRKGMPWRIAVERPTPGEQSVLEVVEIRDTAIATSGDYRNFFMQDGIMYSHTLDPRTASPISHQVASVSVRADTAMMADGWATAMMVMGPPGITLADQLGLAVLMVERDGDGFREIPSKNW